MVLTYMIITTSMFLFTFITQVRKEQKGDEKLVPIIAGTIGIWGIYSIAIYLNTT